MSTPESAGSRDGNPRSRPAIPFSVVVGVCEHPHCVDAIRYAVEWAEHRGGEVVVVHVRRQPPAIAALCDARLADDEWADACERLAFDQAHAVLAGSPVPRRTVTRHGDPAGKLAAVAAELNAAAIVVGDRGPGRSVGRRGSIALSLAGRAVPVVIIPVPTAEAA